MSDYEKGIPSSDYEKGISVIPDMTEIANKLYFTKGYEAGVELEINRIHKAIYDYFRLFDGASTRTHKISEAELITLIREGQNG